jgi:hypothetical protein
MGSRGIYYDLTVTYAVTPADDIDILDEGTYARDRYDSPADALGDLGRFIRDNGGPDAWSETGPYEVASCWLPYGEGTEIAYSARMDRVAVTGNHSWAPISERAAARPGDLGPAQRRQSWQRSCGEAPQVGSPHGGEGRCVTK